MLSAASAAALEIFSLASLIFLISASGPALALSAATCIDFFCPSVCMLSSADWYLSLACAACCVFPVDSANCNSSLADCISRFKSASAFEASKALILESANLLVASIWDCKSLSLCLESIWDLTLWPAIDLAAAALWDSKVFSLLYSSESKPFELLLLAITCLDITLLKLYRACACAAFNVDRSPDSPAACNLNFWKILSTVSVLFASSFIAGFDFAISEIACFVRVTCLYLLVFR